MRFSMRTKYHILFLKFPPLHHTQAHLTKIHALLSLPLIPHVAYISPWMQFTQNSTVVIFSKCYFGKYHIGSQWTRTNINDVRLRPCFQGFTTSFHLDTPGG